MGVNTDGSGFQRSLANKTQVLAQEVDTAQLMLEDMRIRELQRQISCKSRTDELEKRIGTYYSRKRIAAARIKHVAPEVLREQQQEQEAIHTAMLELDAFDARQRATRGSI